MPRNLAGVYSLPAGSIVTDGVDDILASQLNDPLQDFESDANDPRPIVAGGTGGTTEEEARANLALQGAPIHCTLGGTANALTLTTGISLAAITTGMRFSFFYGSVANTGAITIAVDGLTAINGRTMSDAAVPAGYLFNDDLVTITYDGTNFLVDNGPRLRAGAATGDYEISPTGKLMQWHVITASAAGEVTWTYPIEFKAATDWVVMATPQGGSFLTARITSVSRTSVDVSAYNAAGARTANDVHLLAIGRYF